MIDLFVVTHRSQISVIPMHLPVFRDINSNPHPHPPLTIVNFLENLSCYSNIFYSKTGYSCRNC